MIKLAYFTVFHYGVLVPHHVAVVGRVAHKDRGRYLPVVEGIVARLFRRPRNLDWRPDDGPKGLPILGESHVGAGS